MVSAQAAHSSALGAPVAGARRKLAPGSGRINRAQFAGVEHEVREIFCGKIGILGVGVGRKQRARPAQITFGGAVHNGRDTAPVFSDRQSLGCSPLFRESGSVGVRLSANWSVMATVEHLSNGGLCSDENRGLTNVGARVGYSF